LAKEGFFVLRDMLSKKIRMNIIERISQHVKVTQERDEWAKKAIDLLAQGKEKAGLAAAKKAEAFDKKVKALERPEF
jgi:uncharacterized protein Yka (UPF0111/DUF47 family)